EPSHRQERRPLGEVELDRVRLRERGAVLELEHRDPPVAVAREELGRARRAAHHVELDALVRNVELVQQQAHLVAVPGFEEVVELQHRRHCTLAPMSRRPKPTAPRSAVITPEGESRLREEFQRLWSVERPKVAREVGEAAALGDRSENAEYIYG